MIVGISSGESVTREFDVPPNGRQSLEVDFPLNDVTSLQLFVYGSGTDPLAHGAVSSIDGGPPLGADSLLNRTLGYRTLPRMHSE